MIYIYDDLRNKLAIDLKKLDEINIYLTDPDNPLVNDFLKIIDKYGGPQEIRRKRKTEGSIENLTDKLRKKKSPYIKDLEWLIKQKNKGSFIKIDEYRKKILGERFNKMRFNEDYAITLEISACQYFPFFMIEAHRSVEKGIRLTVKVC